MKIVLFSLQRTEEVAHDVTYLVLQVLVFHRVVHRRIIFIDEHNHIPVGLLLGGIDDANQSDIKSLGTNRSYLV